MATAFIKDGIMFRVNPNNNKSIQKSKDKGLNWITVQSLNWEPKDFMVDGKDVIAIAQGGKTYVSHDNCFNWHSK